MVAILGGEISKMKWMSGKPPINTTSGTIIADEAIASMKSGRKNLPLPLLKSGTNSYFCSTLREYKGHTRVYGSLHSTRSLVRFYRQTTKYYITRTALCTPWGISVSELQEIIFVFSIPLKTTIIF